MFNLTNVELSMCVTEYSDLFPNLRIEYTNILYVLRANSGIYVPYRESSRMAGEVLA
jgi:hypothetical protein